jgi:TrpR-related protein YerC/YecD
MSMSKGGDDPAHQLFQAIELLQDVDEIKRFFTNLCTPAELQAMSDRWAVVALLKADIPYRSIHADTGVSVTTIGRVARYLTHGAGGYALVYERTEKIKHVNQKKIAHSRTKKGPP